MRYAIVLILCLSLASLAGQNGFDGREAPLNGSPPSTDNITLTVLDTWSPVNKALGLDYKLPQKLLGTNNEDMVVQLYFLDGTPAGALPLSASNTGCFGVAWDFDYTSSNDVFYTSDWSASNLFYTGIWAPCSRAGPASASTRLNGYSEFTAGRWFWPISRVCCPTPLELLLPQNFS